MSREDDMILINRHPDYGGPFRCDPEIAPLVEALIAAGINTVASCSGHGHRPGVISLADGRELVIARDFAEARKIDSMFPVDINGDAWGGLGVHASSLTDVLTVAEDHIRALLDIIDRTGGDRSPADQETIRAAREAVAGG